MAEKTVTINGTTYNINDLPKEAKQQLLNVQIAENEVKRLQAQLAITQTARNTYQQAVVSEIQKAQN